MLRNEKSFSSSFNKKFLLQIDLNGIAICNTFSVVPSAMNDNEKNVLSNLTM